MKLDFSFVVIGRNAENEIKRCIDSIHLACVSSDIVNDYEIIYVDSNSDDSTVSKVTEYGDVKIISIKNGFTSASLGRSLGLKYSTYNNLVFLDSDMELISNWIDVSYDRYIKYGALVGKRLDVNYTNNAHEKEYSYGMSKSGVVAKIGGFLMFDKDKFPDINYTGVLKDEEESDFVSKINNTGEVFYLNTLAIKHHDRKNDLVSRLMLYFRPYSKTGYLCSLFYSFKNKYFINYLRIQKNYIFDILGSMFLYGSLLCPYSFFVFLILLVVQFKRIKGSLFTQIFFPYKLIAAVLLVTRKRLYSYTVNGGDLIVNDARESVS